MAELGPGPSGFEDDDGSVPDEVATVLASVAVGATGMRELIGVLAGHRLLVPLLEVHGDLLDGDDADPCAGQDRAVAAVSVRTDDGVVGLAFTGMEPLIRWRTEARPMPVPARRVAEALLADGALGLLLDPASSAPIRIPTLALRRLAGGGQWPDPWEDPAVRQAVVGELEPVLRSGELQVRLAAPDGPDAPAGSAPGDHAPGDRPGTARGVELVVEVRFRDRVSVEVEGQRAGVIAERLASSELLREAFDGVLAVRVV
jgi:hypothetical protein